MIELPPLPFREDALIPYMSARTLSFHYGEHHRKYVETTNKLIADTPMVNMNLEEIMLKSFKDNPKLYNNAAQAWNHTFFWKCLKKQEEPSAELKADLLRSFGSVDAFKEDFTVQARELFGSGWTWLVKVPGGDLRIRSMSNAGNPLAEFGEIPLLVCDDWEHAYYLDYQSERPKYLESFWNIVNWSFVASNLKQAFESRHEKTA